MTHSAGRTDPPELTRGNFYTASFWILLLAFEAFLFSLPLFPNGDGGLHIYYATIFRDLLTHQVPLYAQFYAVRHVVQPYSLHYYLFIALRSFLSADTAEKLIVAGVLATLAFGFRSLVRSLSLASPAVVLLIFPFLLNWLLAMGALNYNFAIGMMMFALASYERLGSSPRRLWGYAGLLLLLILSHPVPLLLLASALAVDLILRWWNLRDHRGFVRAETVRLVALGLTCIAFVAPVLLADKAQVAKAAGDIRFHVQYLRPIYNASCIFLFSFAGWRGRLYHNLFFLLLPLSFAVVLATGFLARLRQRTLTSADRLALFALSFLIISLFAPESMNGSAFFAYRLWLPCWLLGIAACAGSVRGSGLNGTAAVYAILLSASVLILAQSRLRPAAVRTAELERAPVPSNATGLFVETQSGSRIGDLGIDYPVYFWAAGRTFIAHNDVMLNSSWLELTIIPLKENGRAGLLRDYTDLPAIEDPSELSNFLVSHPEARARALQDASFLVFSDPGRTPDPDALARKVLGSALPQWRCDRSDFYDVCQKRQGPPTA